jgi:hypothetical protein
MSNPTPSQWFTGIFVFYDGTETPLVRYKKAHSLAEASEKLSKLAAEDMPLLLTFPGKLTTFYREP